MDLVGHVQLRVGDSVRVRVAPDVDETLWDAEGIVAGFRPDNRVLVELGDGADCIFNPEQVDLVEPTDVAETFRGTILESHG